MYSPKLDFILQRGVVQQARSKSDNDFVVPEEDLIFYNKISPVINGTKFPVPPPTQTPEERRYYKLTFRNVRKLYRRNCDLTGRPVLSVFSPGKEFPVYDRNIWWTDHHDVRRFGRDFDFGRPFFEQFNELKNQTPIPSLSIINSENCDFNNNIINCKNCYLAFGSAFCYDCHYVNFCRELRNCVDAWRSSKCELCYSIFRCSGCFDCRWCERCSGSFNLYFCRMCIDCSHCFGCSLLSHKKYCIFNKQYTKEQYEAFIKRINFGSHSEILAIKQEVRAFYESHFMSPNAGEFKENSTGDTVYKAKNCHECYTIENCEECRYLFEVASADNAHDLCCSTVCTGMSYQVVGAHAFFNLLFCYNCNNCSDSFYLFDCIQAKHCFGCVGIYHQEYCIFNKQYSKDEYFKTVAKIIQHMTETGEWGQFFPKYLSRFGYNETDTQIYQPLTKDQALSQGFKWNDYHKEPEASVVTPAANLPDDVADVGDEILQSAIKGEVSGQLFKLDRFELDFYRENNIPIPRRHPEQRYLDMLKLRNPMKMKQRQCDNYLEVDGEMKRCENTFDSSWPLDNKQRVVCVPCYLKLIYY